ncbi:RNA polymerase sigma factor [Fulvivirga ligni]|uniref:RNA polymerase sigma factor n=1 Tax=Fulvivirga ligni TaxID=2904246 RepID=UPI001F2A742C|nr:sigma-70 family RNA polymerase sigma factor [Fulvivirga ligni]UII20057.1 sigma-70 family RNA polymerase sigma factor [Fulvivirga ligni]
MNLKLTEQQFLDILDENQNIIHKVCSMYTRCSEDHNDLFQEIMLQLWKGYTRFKGDAKITTWMYRVSLYTAISIYKKKKFRQEVQDTVLHVKNESEEHDPYQYENLNLAIESLSKTNKALIILYLDEKSYKEIAEIMEISESNVGVKINRIKKQLKDILNQL